MRKNKVDIITLGCSKNLVDSEQLMRQFVANGYTVEHDPHKINGEIVVVNTCGFIGDAQEESINMILELGEQKQKGRIGKLFVMGCLSERFLKDLEKELPEVDRFYGKFNWKELISDLGKSYHQELATDRVLTTPRHYAYVKIGEGCNRTCSYCSIPIITGAYQSRPMDEIVDEEISIGDYVLTGGELPALVLVDTVARMVPGVLPENLCFEDESHFGGLLEYPQYTRPAVWHDREVPPVLLTGHHKNIAEWRQAQSLEETKTKRPDLYASYLDKK